MIDSNPISVSVDIIVSDLLKQQDITSTIANALELLKFKRYNSDSTNYEKISRGYTQELQTENDLKFSSGDLLNILITSGVTFYLANSIANREVLAPVLPDQFSLTEYKPFLANALNNLLRDKNYINVLVNQQGNQIGRVISNEVTVLMWVRALTPQGDNSQSGKWINISSFVETVQMNSVGAGGSFSLTMQPLTCSSSQVEGWEFQSRVRTSGEDSIVNSTILKTSPLGEFKRNDFLFHTVIQQNDLVMIKMERLGTEKRRPIEVDDTSSIDITGEDKCYDMIGFVDSTSQSTTPGDVTINITGRDFTKMLIEDGSIFFPEQFAQDIFSSNGVLAQRNRLELELQSVAAGTYQFKTIDIILKFIFNKYSNIGYVPDNVFGLWGNRSIVSKYQLSGNFTTSPTSATSVVKTDQFGSSLEVVKSQSDNVFLSQASERFLNEERRGAWRISELIVDPQIKQRVLVDNNINHDSGSILNTINKVCQMPFVQFYTDTYGDKFYGIARKPPFDEQGVKGMIYDFIETDQVSSSSSPTETAKKSLFGRIKNTNVKKVTETIDKSLNQLQVLEIDDSQVLSEKLTYHDEAYSWYRIIPRGLAVNDQALFSLTPIITLDEYGEVFGSRPFSIEYNYCPADFVVSSNYTSNMNYVEGQVFRDLKFLIESYQYLPFTRRGTITIDGDRRIKKGTFIRYKPTDEIFYVEGVSNVRSLSSGINERITTLQVTRGMKESFIKGIAVSFPDGSVENVSYFNIVKTELPNNADINNKGFLKNWKVNKNVFNFFLQRRQNASLNYLFV